MTADSASPAWARWAVALAWALAAVHAATALGKLLDLPGFAAVVGSYRLLPAALLLPVAVLVALVEAAIAAGLVLPGIRRIAARAAIGLAALNAIVLVATLLRGISLPNCGCFGVFLAQPLTPFSPLEDLALIAVASALLWGAAPRGAAIR